MIANVAARALALSILVLAGCAHAPPHDTGPHQMRIRTVAMEYPRLPNEVRLRHQGQQLQAAYVVSVASDGHVTAVRSLTKMADVDAAVIPVVLRWKYAPLEAPIQTPARFVWDIPLAR